ncbi:MAG TPA: cytochrome c-type biogenesis protein [Gammaproteobacteria bacterium]|nr:cytochrome c-type biogenesis protein [Gammaproteobacteria bacterium]
MLEARLIFMALICLCIAQLAFAIEPNFAFKSPQEEQRFVKLSKQIRCSVCQNTSIFDSNSQHSGFLREKLYNMLDTDMTDQQILSSLRQDYGAQVSFMPAWGLSTLLLWLGPIFMLGAALLFAKRFLAKKSRRE